MNMAKAISRRILSAAALGLAAGPARAQAAWPDHPIRIVAPFAPGGNTDLVARLIGAHLSPMVGQPILVENRPGANTILGTQSVLTAPADGHSWLLATASPVTMNPQLYRRLPYQAEDLAVGAILALMPVVAVVAAGSPYRTLGDLQAAARAQPGGLNFASAGIGNTTHLVAELFCQAAGVSMAHIPFNGSAPALLAVMRGDAAVCFDIISSSIQMIRDGTLRALGVTTPRRVPALPELPTALEQGFAGFVVVGWVGIALASRTPPGVFAQVRAALAELQGRPDFVAGIAGLGLLPDAPRDAAGIEAFVEADREMWARAISANRIVLD
jgi:tripartite-type tricarboxylate transporter receptor subunit TctC